MHGKVLFSINHEQEEGFTMAVLSRDKPFSILCLLSLFLLCSSSPLLQLFLPHSHLGVCLHVTNDHVDNDCINISTRYQYTKSRVQRMKTSSTALCGTHSVCTLYYTSVFT